MNTQNTSNKQPGFKPTQEEAFAFLDTQILCVLSTLDATGQPHGSTVSFSQTSALQFIIGTDIKSRKSVNMQHDGRVALTITDAEKRYTVQATGQAKLIDAQEFEGFADEHYRKLPHSLPFKDIKDQVHFLITPTSVRFSDCSAWPWVVTELIK